MILSKQFYIQSTVDRVRHFVSFISTACRPEIKQEGEKQMKPNTKRKCCWCLFFFSSFRIWKLDTKLLAINFSTSQNDCAHFHCCIEAFISHLLFHCYPLLFLISIFFFFSFIPFDECLNRNMFLYLLDNNQQ